MEQIFTGYIVPYFAPSLLANILIDVIRSFVQDKHPGFRKKIPALLFCLSIMYSVIYYILSDFTPEQSLIQCTAIIGVSHVLYKIRILSIIPDLLKRRLGHGK